jgi:hypothetical protein
MNADAESFDYIVVAGIRRLPARQSSDRPRPSPWCCWGGRNDRNIWSTSLSATVSVHQSQGHRRCAAVGGRRFFALRPQCRQCDGEEQRNRGEQEAAKIGRVITEGSPIEL